MPRRDPDPRADPVNALRGRSFVLLLLATFGAVSNYATLLAVVPLWAASGGSEGTGVGATTGVMMGATVVSQLCMGWLFRLLSLRVILAIGAAMMGLATPAYGWSDALGPVLAVSAVRGFGFGMVVVAGSALTAALIPNTQLGKGVGLYGLATGLPSVACMPAGVWVAQEIGFEPVFIATTVLALVAVPIALGVRRAGVSPEPREPAPRRIRMSSRLTPLLASCILMVGVSIGLGGTSTFLPLALSHAATASVSLLALSLGINIGRMGAGAISDTIGSGRLLLPAIAAATLGMAGIALVAGLGGGAVAALAAAAYGLGFGAVQNDTLVIMLRRGGPKAHGLVSTSWNMAYDGGTGVGAIALGVVVTWSDEAWAFAVSAMLIGLTLPLAWREGRR